MKLIPIIAVWCVVVVLGWFLYVTFLGGMGSYRSAYVDGAHLRSFYAIYTLILFCGALFLAFLLMSSVKNLSVQASFAILIGCGALALGIERIYVAMNPQPSIYKATLLGIDYAIPREFTRKPNNQTAKVTQLSIRVCKSTRSLYRAGQCEAEGLENSFDIISLVSSDLTREFWIKDTLQDLDVPFEGDRLGAIPSDLVEMVDGVHVLRSGNAVLMMELEPDRRILRAVWCRETMAQCSGHAHTEYGLLRFPVVGKAQVDKALWDAEQASYVALFEAWMCSEPTCGGVFLDGAVEGYE